MKVKLTVCLSTQPDLPGPLFSREVWGGDFIAIFAIIVYSYFILELLFQARMCLNPGLNTKTYIFTGKSQEQTSERKTAEANSFL